MNRTILTPTNIKLSIKPNGMEGTTRFHSIHLSHQSISLARFSTSIIKVKENNFRYYKNNVSNYNYNNNV